MNRRTYVRQILDAAKARPCMRCGNEFPTYVMDFDHRPGTRKCFNLSLARKGTIPLELVYAEMRKCDVVCSNCHRIREHERVHGVKRDSAYLSAYDDAAARGGCH